jgi:hypothetical protein
MLLEVIASFSISIFGFSLNTHPEIGLFLTVLIITLSSFLNSIAVEATEFANPVTGTIEPAPAKLPILS